jgi:pimeloyl-ACP methyl ester carboxylesterase
MPLSFLLMWLAGLFSIAVLGGGTYTVWAWYQGELVSIAWLILGLILLVWSVAGRLIQAVLRQPGVDEPRSQRNGRTQHIAGPDGSMLQIEEYGPDGGPIILMTHGWDLDATTWYYEKKHFTHRFRLVLWDLPGLGLSSRPSDGRYSLERFAHNLKAVLDATAQGRPVALLGHSIGGMTILTFCRLFPETMGSTVAGIVLVNTTYTMPLNTVVAGGLLRAIRIPILVPLLYLTIWLSPLVWAMNWLSYLNGSSHRTTNWTSFSGYETRGQLDFAARFTAKQSPAVLAKGILAMLSWDETATLPDIRVPTLIITSDHDKLTVPAASEHMAAAIPGAELVRVSPAGHPGFLECSAQYDEAIAAFSARCLAQAIPTGGRLRSGSGMGGRH